MILAGLRPPLAPVSLALPLLPHGPGGFHGSWRSVHTITRTLVGHLGSDRQPGYNWRSSAVPSEDESITPEQANPHSTTTSRYTAFSRTELAALYGELEAALSASQ